MEVHLTQEQESRLSSIASHYGKNAEQVIVETVTRILDEDERFRAAVAKGIDSLDRGEFVEHEEVEAMIDQLLRS